MSPFTLRPHPRNAGSSLPYTWQDHGAQGQGAGQGHHTALGTQGRAQGWAQPSLRAPLLVSSVCSQRPKHRQRKGLWEGRASSCLGSLQPESERQC